MPKRTAPAQPVKSKAKKGKVDGDGLASGSGSGVVPVSALSAGKTRWRVRISLHSKELRSVTTKKGPTHVLNATFFDASGFIKLVWWGDRAVTRDNDLAADTLYELANAQLEAADAYQTLGDLSARVDFTTTFRSLGASGAALPDCPALDFVDVESLLTADTLGKYNLGPSVVVEYSDAETVQYRDGGNGVVRALTVTNLTLQNVIVLKVWGDTANDPIFAEPGAPQIPFEITATGVTINAYKGNRELTLGKSGTASYGKSRPDINPDLIATTEPLSTATAEKDAAIFDLHGKLTRFYVKVTPDGGTPPRSPGQIRMIAHHFVGKRSELEAKLAEKYKTNLAELSDDDGGGGTAADSQFEV